MFAEIIIPLAIPKTYTYSIPMEMQDIAVPGVRVEVVFGRQKRYAGIIKSVTTIAPQGFEPKALNCGLDSRRRAANGATQCHCFQSLGSFALHRC